jgi:hypothetical protein
LKAATKTLTFSIASLLVVASAPQELCTARVVSDCWRWVSRTREVADEADTEADTDAR